MSGRGEAPSSISRRLLDEPRRAAGVDGEGEPVRLGERDSGGHLVGYVDPSGLAWESLTEQLVATDGGRLAEALCLPDGDRGRDDLLDQILADVPDELIGAVARQAAALLALRVLPQPGEPEP